MNTSTFQQASDRAKILRDPTVRNEDARRYAQLAHRWWDGEGPFWPLHRLNQLRLGYLANSFRRSSASLEQPLQGLRCVDIGCGGGLLSEGMAKLGATVTGIDVVDRNLEAARIHAQQQNLDIDYRLVTAGELADEGRQYDLVLNMEVVEHVDNFTGFMSQCCALVKPGGHMAVATLNRTPEALVSAIIGAEYILRWLPRGTHRWRDFRKPKEVIACLGAGGLSCYDRRGVRVNPLTRRFSLTNSDRINYILLARKTHANAV